MPATSTTEELKQKIKILEHEIDQYTQKNNAQEKTNHDLEKKYRKNTHELAQSNQQLGLEIAERKQTEKDLRESQDKYKSLFTNINIGVAVFKPMDDAENFIFEDINKAAENIEAIEKERILGQTVTRVFPGIKDFGLFDVFKRVTETGVPEHHPIIVYKNEKISGWRDHYVYKLPTGEIVAVYTDETKRKQTEKALQDSKDFYDSILRNSFDGITVITEDKYIIFYSPGMEKILGYKNYEVATFTRWINQIFSEDNEHKNIFNQWIKNTDENKPSEHIFQISKKNGEKCWCRFLISKMPGGITVLNCQDITTLRRSENALRKNEEQYRLFLENFQGIAYQTHNMHLKPFFFHGAVEEICGYSSEEILNGTVSWKKLIHPEDLFRIMDETEKLSLIPNYVTDVEYRIHNKNGEIRWIRDVAASMRNDPDDTHIIQGALYDITEHKHMDEERKQMEIQIRQSQKMEALGALAGGISHDFNNILFPILGFAEIMKEDLSSDNPLMASVEQILNGTKRARDLVKHILMFSRQTEQKLKPLKVQHILKEVLLLSRSTLPSTIKINQHINKECGPILADPVQIHQIGMNLITNAFHAMQKTGGILEIKLDRYSITPDDQIGLGMKPGEHICLSVSDTGVGMEKHVLDRIFDPYFTTKDVNKGTGLGLSVVHGIMKSYSGEITVLSEPGKGTVFNLYFPQLKADTKIQKTEKAEEIQTGNEKILLVDDEKLILTMEKQLLERLGYNVTIKNSGGGALKIFQEDPYQFDLVITDMTMPDLTGDKLASELMKIRHDIPVILCTGFSENISKEKAEALGVKGFLLKPILKSKLSKMIREALWTEKNKDSVE